MPLSRTQFIGIGSVATGLIAIAVTGIVVTQTRDGGDNTTASLLTGPLSPPPSSPSAEPTPATPTPSISPAPSSFPSLGPSSVPSVQPTVDPSGFPSLGPSSVPSVQPTVDPSGFPSLRPSSVPSDQPTVDPSGTPSVQPTMAPSGKPSPAPVPPKTVFYAGNDGDDIFPLPQCAGDCDGADDCQGELVCLQRGSSASLFVPGCDGSAADDGTDYCVDPSDIPADGVVRPTPTSFRLKMYWEDGYRWQESSTEEFYCMECDGSCSSGKQIEVQDCDDDSTWFEWLNLDAVGKTQINVVGTNLCFEIVGNNRMEIQDCVYTPDYERQQFVAINGTFTGDGRFEIGTVFRPGGCLTQQHHPRPGEEIKRVDCPDTRDDDTSFWVKY